ncbi:hybrid sensor histidine kinase/response regulator [uncultured Methylophaga sp.]|uniref:hybrid sensor histidine kinase/response regulator n=1 Tax=uncultured Methylophaga sp. TaxID=285271 RepID=UPI0026344B85|nr:hybrid sensor histidine kinase/response regulator [uncultured Methylophaga sp.]
MSETRETEQTKKTSRLLPETGDSEPEQAIKVRLGIGLAILLYFCVPWGADEQFLTTLLSTPSLVTMVYYAGAIAIAIAIYLRPRPSPVRRVAGIWLDLTSLSILMIYSGDESVFLFVIYLWVILGNGFRFGSHYLYISLAIGILGFTTALSTGDYWQDIQHKPIGYSLLLLLLLIPLYSAFLINKLHAAIRSAKLANEAKSRFLANMSHELRTPLNGVIGIADLLGETSMSRQQHEFVSIMRSSANTLLGLIENVLDISKIEAGKINIAREPFDLHSLTNNITQLQSTMGTAKGLRVTQCIDSRIDFHLLGDPQHLRQVLINLMGNAIKFTNTGSVKLLIQQLDADKMANKVRIRFEIQDTGIGISEDNIETIFEDFTQANNSGAVKYQGTGLGTTISKQLVELMGGEIGVESELGSGTTFWFELAFDTDSSHALQLTDQKVLLLTSEQSAHELRQNLDSWHVQHQTVTSSAQAMAALMNADSHNQPFDTLIVEQNSMSGITPVQYAQMLSQEQQLEQLSLILIHPEDDLLTDDALNLYYLSSIRDLADKRTLFNALHASEASHQSSSNVVSLNDFYHSQATSKKALTILVAEDNHVNQRVLEGMLGKLGHHVLLADNGEIAMDIISDRHDDIDLMILDMNMPEYSGAEILKAMRFIDSSRKIPSIMLTADATPEAEQRSKEAGADLFLTKPIDSKKLLAHIAVISNQLAELQPDVTETATQDESKEALINHRHLQDLEALGGGAHFMADLVEGFSMDGRKHLTIINRSWSDDYYQYRESLHALKGTSTELGAQRLSSLCREAEQLKPDQINSDEMQGLVQEINQVFEDTLSGLKSALQTEAHQTSQ